MLEIREGGAAAHAGLRRIRTALASLVFTACALSSGVANAQFSVSSGGSPSYGATITVPPGIAGMAPNLSLVYTGGGVNGPAGFGWTLTGISLITRCPGNAAQDGKPLAVTYTPADRLCLDGQRLIETSSAGVPAASSAAANGALLDANGQPEDGTSFTEYRTDKDLYSRIRAYGMAKGAAANGPRYFKVWTKAGQIYEYGASPSADSGTNALIVPYGKTVAAAWAVARISDTLGNFIDFKYSYQNVAWGSGVVSGTPTTGHEWNIAEIQYTGTASQAAANKVVFEYETRPDTPGASQDRSEAYHAGSKNVSTQRLKAIRTYVNWPAPALGVNLPGGALVQPPPSSAVKVKTFKISYENGNTGRSRIIGTRECVGAAETTCLPGPSFQYTSSATNEVYAANAAFNASTLATLQLEKADGTLGVLVGDFNGDGRSDIIRWSTTVGQNLLYTSNGDGTFTAQSGFGLSNVILFDTAGCYTSMVMDFNGDGKADVLRIMHPTSPSGSSCGTPTNVLYLSKGDGTFTAVTLPSYISFAQSLAVSSTTQSCNLPNVVGVSTALVSVQPAAINPPVCPNPHWVYSKSQGANYHVLDVNGDGIPDIVTTILPAYANQILADIPSVDELCAGVVCSHVYLGSSSGTFAEYTATNLANHSVYGPPRNGTGSSTRFRPYVGDVDGDGLQDLAVDTGTWRSLGTGDFVAVTSGAGACAYPLDFNGDGRADCLWTTAGYPSMLFLGDGGTYPQVANFNLSAVGVLSPASSTGGPGVGVVLADLDGDGRTDLIRWADDPTQDTVYLSNGDGTFRTSTLFNLNTAAYALKKSDGTIDFVTGDFTGNGNTEILRTVSAITAGATATTNQLFVKTINTPPDQLLSMTSPTGLSSTLTYVTLTNSTSGTLGARYRPGPSYGAPAVYPKIDLTLPMWVVATVRNATGVGTTTTQDEYAYGGLRANLAGYGLLGFATVSEQHSAPDGSPLTTVTTYLQDSPYIGVAGVTQTQDGALNASSPALISRTTNSYCDTTSSASPAAITAGGTIPANCSTTSLVARPYLYQSFEEGWDIDASRTALPTVTTTNTFNGSGDATNIVVTTQGTSLGVAQTVTKTTANVFNPDVTSGNSWILGRLSTSTQTNTVPYILGSISTSAGTAPYATATTGTPLAPVLTLTGCTTVSPVTTPARASQSCVLGNSGQAAAGAIQYTSSLASVSVTSAPSSCAASTSNCGTVTVTTNGTVGTFSGNLVATPNSGSGASAAFNLVVNTAAQLTLTACSANSPVTAPAQATQTCTVGNGGQTAATAISYASSAGGTTVSGGPTTCAAGTTNCGTVTVSSPGTAGNYVGSLTATPASGNAATASFNLTVYSPAALTLSACSANSPVVMPATASQTCVVGNSGQVAASGIQYSSTLGTTSVSGGPSTCAANTANCGSVTVTTNGTAGSFSGTMVATPGSGSAASAAFNLVVNTAAQLYFTGCSSSSPVIAPAQATQTCTVGNSGQTAASGISYSSTNASMSVGSGPTSCAASTSNCGSVTVKTPTTSGTYTGNMVATPSSGGAGSTAFSLTVYPAAVAFTVVSNGLTSTFTNPNPYAVTPSSSGLNPSNTIFAQITSNTCSGSIASNGTCKIVFVANTPDCKQDNYSVQAYVTASGYTTYGTMVYKTTNTGVCN